jgi:hypothetical protein
LHHAHLNLNLNLVHIRIITRFLKTRSREDTTREEGDNYYHHNFLELPARVEGRTQFRRNNFFGTVKLENIIRDASSKAPAVTPRGEEKVMFYTLSAPPRCNRKKKGKAVHLHMTLPSVPTI